MKQNATHIITAALVLVLLGQGCGRPTPATDTYGYNPDGTPSGQANAPEPAEPTPEPTQSTSTDPDMNKTYAFPGIRSAEEVNKQVRIRTNKGDIVIQVDAELGPRAASNFVYLAGEGFYDGTIFHRVIPGFMIQGGDPTGTGTSGPGYQFENDPVTALETREVTTDTGRRLTLAMYEKGIVAMANAGRDTNGSQFFIMVDDVELPPDYSVFGRVVEGQDIADEISNVERLAPGQLDRPTEEIKMLSVTIEE